MPPNDTPHTIVPEGALPVQEIQRQLAALWRANDDNRQQIDAVRRQLESNSQSLLRQEMLLQRIAEKLEEFGGSSPPRRCTENAMTLKAIVEQQDDLDERMTALENTDCCKQCKNDGTLRAQADLIKANAEAIRANSDDIKALNRLVYIGLGVLLAIQVVLPIVVNLFKIKAG